jgi:cobalt-zinc-cadmium efflux system protein
MEPGHQHGAAVSAGGAQRGRLLTVLAITAVVLAAEVVGGVITGSLALLADAGHMFTDVAGLGLAVLAVTFAAKSPTAQRTYGYYPAGDLGRGGQRDAPVRDSGMDLG